MESLQLHGLAKMFTVIFSKMVKNLTYSDHVERNKLSQFTKRRMIQMQNTCSLFDGHLFQSVLYDASESPEGMFQNGLVDQEKKERLEREREGREGTSNLT